MELGLAKRVIFITGASGGIGKQLVKTFLSEGAFVVAHARRKHTYPKNVLSFDGDVCDSDSLSTAMQKAVSQWGRIDVCITSAGIWPEEAIRLDQISTERIQNVLQVNLLGSILTARAFMKTLQKTGPRNQKEGASLLFIGSTAGRFGEKGHAVYSASKSALRGLLLSIKNEIVSLDPNARVNLVEPGWTVTPMTQVALSTEGAFEQASRTMPLRKPATPEDIANSVLYFASPRFSSHVTGEILTVAGGMEGRILWETT